MEKKNRVVRPRLELQANSENNSCYWPIIRYYQNESTQKVRSMIEQAARLFWVPNAYEQELTTSIVKTVQSAYVCRSGVNWRIEEIRHQFSRQLENQETVPITDPLDSKVVWHWSCRPNLEKDSELEILWRYLKSEAMGLTLKEKILRSSLAYWGIDALRELGINSQKSLSIMASNCINYLTKHCQLLTESFNLDSQSNPIKNRREVGLSEDYCNLEFPSTTITEKSEIQPQDLLDCSELDEVGWQMFGDDQFSN